jgi:glycosyltransferase involved in cell wall biosynthesis
MAVLLAEHGEIVHVVSQLWHRATREVERLCGGRLVIHRVPLDEPVPAAWHLEAPELAASALAGLRSESPSASFGWQASLLAEMLVEREAIDVVEAQDFEAPLYYFQLRRALGRGPAHRPPCFVHLHSPTEYIFRYNEWNLGRRDYLPQKRLEEYSIAAADALLCPSRSLAREVEAQFGLRDGSVHVVRYPIGDFTCPERTTQTWAEGTVCYVGRLELRKGVVEYLDAAIDVARNHAGLCFDFVGSDTPLSGEGGRMVGERLHARIPDDLRPRFRFHGGQPQAQLPRLLASACIAVVPSRWENFPNACVEAMGSGLPVVVSPVGGMVEMVDDGRTGWLATSVGSEGLRMALERALATSPAEREAMGRAAAAAVRRHCDNAAILNQHLAWRRDLATAGPGRSLRLPPVLPHAAGRSEPPLRRSTCEEARRESGLALVVTAVGDNTRLDDCLAAVSRQVQSPAAVALVIDEGRDDAVRDAARHARAVGWHVVNASGCSLTAVRNAGIRVLLDGGTVPIGIAFVDAECRLQPAFVEDCASTLRRCPEVGVISSWTRFSDTGNVFIRPCPAFPYQWLRNDAASSAAVRTRALLDAGLFRPELDGRFAWWDLVNAVMAAGWVAVTYPAILSDADDDSGAIWEPCDDQMRRALLERFPDLLAGDASELTILRDAMRVPVGRAVPDEAPVVAQVLTPSDIVHASLARKIQIARRAVREPRNALRWLIWHGRRSFARGAARVCYRARAAP